MASDSAAATATAASTGSDDWCTIESDPGVFTELLETLGCENVQLEELFTLEDDSLQALRESTDNQVYGLIFLFQWQKEAQRSSSSGESSPDAGASIPEDLFFAHQVTTNACATQAILSVVLNYEGLKLGKVLSEFKDFTKSFPPQLKGMSISSSNEIKTAHNSFGRSGEVMFWDPESAKRNRNKTSDEVYHFVAYIPKGDKVYELDGLQEHPIEVGDISSAMDTGGETKTEGDAAAAAASSSTTNDWLSIARTAIQQRMIAQGSELIKFNLMAVCQDKRIPLQKVLEIDPTNDSAKFQLEAEEARRTQWKMENQRRRHNYVPLCISMLKELAKMRAPNEDGSTNEEKSMLTHLYEQAKERKQKQRAANSGKKEDTKDTSAKTSGE